MQFCKVNLTFISHLFLRPQPSLLQCLFHADHDIDRQLAAILVLYPNAFVCSLLDNALSQLVRSNDHPHKCQIAFLQESSPVRNAVLLLNTRLQTLLNPRYGLDRRYQSLNVPIGGTFPLLTTLRQISSYFKHLLVCLKLMQLLNTPQLTIQRCYLRKSVSC